MGFFKKLGKIVNKVTDFAAPIAGYVPGIGPVIAGGLDAAGDLAGGKNLKSAVLSGLKTGGQSYLGGKLAGKLGSIAMKGAAGAVSKGAAGAAPRVIGIGPGGVPMIDQTGSVTSAMSGGGGGSSWTDKLGSVLGGGNKTSGPGGIDWGKILGGALKVAPAAVGAYQASKTQGQADDYRKKALGLIESEYAAGAPLRSMGLEGMTDPRLADVSSIFAKKPQNFRRITV